MSWISISLISLTALWATEDSGAAMLQVERLAEEFQRLTLDRENYDEAMEVATSLRRLGRENKDPDLKARGLIRLAYAQIHFGRWGPKWDRWQRVAFELTEGSQPFGKARAETLMYSGYIAAVYLGESSRGISMLGEAIDIALDLEDDSLIAMAYYCASRALPFEGEWSLSWDYAYRSYFFSREADAYLAEYRAVRRLLHLGNCFDQENPRWAERRDELEKLIGKSTSRATDFTVAHSESELRELIENHQDFEQVPELQRLTQARVCLNACMHLLPRITEQERWGEIEEVLKIAERTAEYLQDRFTSLQLLKYRALHEVWTRNAEQAEKTLQPLVQSLSNRADRSILAGIYSRMATVSESSSETESPTNWIRKAAAEFASRGMDSHPRETAESFFESELRNRELRRRLRDKSSSLSRAVWALVATGVVVLGAWIGQRAYQSQRDRILVQAKVASQTESLRAAKEAAENANRAKTDFLVRVNHELRNPLTSIVGCSELLAQRDGATTTTDVDRTLRASTKHLLDVVDELLDFSKIESGKIQVQPRIFRLLPLLEAVVCLARHHCRAPVSLELVGHRQLPEEIVADEAKLRQALVNLLCKCGSSHRQRNRLSRMHPWRCGRGIDLGVRGCGYRLRDGSRHHGKESSSPTAQITIDPRPVLVCLSPSHLWSAWEERFRSILNPMSAPPFRFWIPIQVKAMSDSKEDSKPIVGMILTGCWFWTTIHRRGSRFGR